MTVGGWFDAEDMYGALHTYQSIEKQNPPSTKNYLVMGHGPWSVDVREGHKPGEHLLGLDANLKFAEEEVSFFDY